MPQAGRAALPPNQRPISDPARDEQLDITVDAGAIDEAVDLEPTPTDDAAARAAARAYIEQIRARSQAELAQMRAVHQAQLDAYTHTSERRGRMQRALMMGAAAAGVLGLVVAGVAQLTQPTLASDPDWGHPQWQPEVQAALVISEAVAEREKGPANSSGSTAAPRIRRGHKPCTADIFDPLNDCL